MKFPANLDKLTPELLTRIIQQQHKDVVVESFEVKQRAKCGDGIASTADRITLRVAYKDGCSGGLPTQIILKTILLHRLLRFGLPMILGLSSSVNMLDKLPVINKVSRNTIFTLVNIYQRFFPHAPEAMYANEVHFYNEIRPHIDFESPASYGCVFDEQNGQFAVLMEDLSLRNATFPNATMNINIEQMKSLLDNLAKLHAKNWKSEKLDTEYSWLPKTFEGGMFPVFDAIGLDIIQDQVNKNQFKQELLAPLNKSVEELWNANWKAQQLLYQREPLSLIHGDTHIGNTYLLPKDKGGLLDWQLIVKGPWVNDVSYLLATGLCTEDRRQHEKTLLKHYWDCLNEHGVSEKYDEEHTWKSYRIAAIWGLVIGWLITPPQNYGKEITYANISRTTNTIMDLKSFEALEEIEKSQ